MNKPSILQRFSIWLYGFTGLAAVTPIPVGHKDDGLTLHPSGTPLDKAWSDLYLELTDARDAWHKNPLARRLIGLITSYCVGSGIKLHSDYKPLQRFIDEFWQRNNMEQRIDDWSDELARSGELFPVLFHNPISGMSIVRSVPSCLIEALDYNPDDYETEYAFRESQPIGVPEKWWRSPAHPDADPTTGLMLHYAVNRPVGALRGESDLAPILPWLRRYNRWLEDRVRLNAAMRAFLWIVHAPARLRTELEERYRTPPSAGSVIIAEEGVETWEAITPNLHAADAEKDGRAIRWMIVSGGPGTALLDIGEGEDSNLATGKAMAEQRRRFLRRRQSYLTYLLTDLVYTAWTYSHHSRSVRSSHIDRSMIHAVAPDISPEDNTDLASAASSLANALTSIANLVGAGDTFRASALRMFAKFAGEQISEDDIKLMISEGEDERTRERNRQTAEQRPFGNDQRSNAVLSGDMVADGAPYSNQTTGFWRTNGS